MALESILNLVLARVPWLTAADATAVQVALDYQYIMLQPYTQKTDEEVDVEANYTKLQRLLLTELTAYQLVVQKAMETTGGKAGGKPGGRAVKKAKADVVETEFETIKASDGASIALETGKLLDQLRMQACALARQLGYSLPLCGVAQAEFIPFITLTDLTYPSPNYG